MMGADAPKVTETHHQQALYQWWRLYAKRHGFPQAALMTNCRLTPFYILAYTGAEKKAAAKRKIRHFPHLNSAVHPENESG